MVTKPSLSSYIIGTFTLSMESLKILVEATLYKERIKYFVSSETNKVQFFVRKTTKQINISDIFLFRWKLSTLKEHPVSAVLLHQLLGVFAGVVTGRVEFFVPHLNLRRRPVGNARGRNHRARRLGKTIRLDFWYVRRHLV